MGYINKRSKGSIKYFQKRWFILISAKSLNNENDDFIVDENYLPAWMSVDVLYYYDVNIDENL